MNPDGFAKRLYFDVFGRVMRVERQESGWLAFAVSSEGKSARIPELTIPPDLREDELRGYLDDLFHEYATPERPAVMRLAGLEGQI